MEIKIIEIVIVGLTAVGFCLGLLLTIRNLKASNESLSVRDNESKKEKCPYYPCDGDFDCPYPMERGEPDCR